MTTERTATINALTTMLRVFDLGIDARKPLAARQVREVARWRSRAEGLATATTRAEAVRLAKRVADLSRWGADRESESAHRLIRASKAADLLGMSMLGPSGPSTTPTS